MREIKFRGKGIKTDKQELVYGWGCFTDENERYFIIVSPEQFIQVEKIDEFTGLKDKNGNKEIYEGDVVETGVKPRGKVPDIYKVEYWDEGHAAYHLTTGGGGGIPMEWACHRNDEWKIYGEIIGNVHENPELINPSKD